mmetsp:Transcript_8761/g.21385  ORF Transcript_8761/g.21385 Transcript_8761/m.21385 type:complete len:348 (+) Transcript_8761:182-1225(+)|eukprot:CAMPEP_0197183860 /NCGR_PEP_ID=MMETSP1423-20130617/8596_1 /TAXON_ID=476441 /ORGANISM="Pseudo-nitzschia heimii, Strain UNC1101" /LENGTH=347 /DNA_ID=CAMNT_0042634511 /DNA_START=108 /DNA_END=1151 /DNA_ORIENTATION=+
MMGRNTSLSFLITILVAPSLSFVPQSQRVFPASSTVKVNRLNRAQHVLAVTDDASTEASTDFVSDDDGDGSSNEDSNSKEGKMSSVFSTSVQTEAREVLEKVGWAGVAPDLGDPEQPMTSDDPFVQNIDAGIRKDFGVGLDDLLNPAKVVNLERELYQLREELQNTKDQNTIESIATSIEKKEKKLAIERRSVFRDWLKNIFVGQAVISFGISYIMATNPSTLFGGFDWYYYNSMDISIQVLGYWFWWLFIVPSLRSRRPRGYEKKALDIAFLATPIVSLAAPVVTKDTGLIWTANFLIVAGSYAFSFATEGDDDDDDDGGKNQPAWLKFVYKSLDFGSGRERGLRQ